MRQLVVQMVMGDVTRSRIAEICVDRTTSSAGSPYQSNTDQLPVPRSSAMAIRRLRRERCCTCRLNSGPEEVVSNGAVYTSDI